VEVVEQVELDLLAVVERVAPVLPQLYLWLKHLC
jgi:hypothetical protein